MILNLKSVLLSVKELVGVYAAALERELKACYKIGVPSLDLGEIDQGFGRCQTPIMFPTPDPDSSYESFIKDSFL